MSGRFVLRRGARGVAAALVLLAAIAGAAQAQQSDNHVLLAVPAPGKVAIDGKLDDWDLSGRIVVCSDVTRLLGKYSAFVAMMYDAEALYVGVDWFDPTPMVNNYDPHFDIDLRRCFHSDSIQLHFRTDQERKVIGWLYTRTNTPAINVLDGWFPWLDDRPIHYMDGIREFGITEAFQPKPDAAGYLQEIRIPWAAVVKSGRAYRAGESFDCMLDLVWGPEGGKGWPVNHMMDLVEPGSVHTGWFWEVKPIYGKVELVPAGNLKLPEPEFIRKAAEKQPRLQNTEGPVELNYTMPFDGFVTLVIEDEQGRRVKNLVGMAPRGKGRQTDHWDCANEEGSLVPPGKYRFRGLLHKGIEPTYAATYCNPGTPPWDTADGTGAWLSDHCAPRAVAAAGDLVVLGAERSESGDSIICSDLDGRKKWGDRGFAGVYSLAADKEHVFIFLSSWDVPPALARLELKTGRFAPFATKSGPQLKVSPFKEGEKPVWVPGIAVSGDRLAVSMGEMNLIRFFDKQTAAITGEMAVPKPGCLAFDAAGTLYVWAEEKLQKIVDGKLVPFIADAKWPAAICVDAAGQVFLVDRSTQQVKVYGTDGKLARAIGLQGGRPATGTWKPDGMLNPASIAVDSRGQLWVAEEDVSPKRISVWNAQGKLVKDYIGPTSYGGGGANADPDDLSRVFGSGCEFRLDYAANKAAVVAALGDPSGQLMKIKGREYFMNKEGKLFLRKGDSLKVVAAMATFFWKDAAQYKEYPLPQAPEGTHGYASMSFVWSDVNDDGKPQADEVVTGSRWSKWTDWKYPVGVAGYFGSYWLDEAFNLYGYAGESYGSSGGRGPFVTRIPLKGWTPGGAPLWDVKSQRLLAELNADGRCLYLPCEGRVIAGEPITCIRDDGAILWTYRNNWAGVHASHNAPIPDRDDLLIGTLGCIGRAKTPLGTVFAMHSNMGRLYLMTTDGLFVASVFQDCRLGGDPWPREAKPGAPLGGVTMGSEWFGGHFFRAGKTGDYYLIAGFTAYNLIKLNGFETLKAIPGGTLTVAGGDLASAEQQIRQRTAKQAAKAALAITLLDAAPAIDGKLDEYPKDRFVEWSSGPYTVRAAVAADAANLYLAYDVSGDANPMVNGGKDVNQLFITGDSVDLQFGSDPAADAKRGEAATGDVRLLISVFNGEPVAVLYRWKASGRKTPVTFTCPWRSCTVDSVEVVKDAKISIGRGGRGYIVEAAVPLAALAFAPQAGKTYGIDLGVIYSDAKGTNRAARVYWSNKATGLTADVPGEIMAFPGLWGTALWGAATVSP